MSNSKQLRFPEDFKKSAHQLGSGVQYVWPQDRDAEISIVGGHWGLYGDGITTFEMYDFREGDIQGHLTIDQINKHLKNNPFDI